LLCAGPVEPNLLGMGEEVAQQEFTREDRTRYREKVRRCLDVFARMLRESRFDADYPMTGMEIELNLVDDAGDPALKNTAALEAIADPDFQTELGQFNLEINVPPKQLKDRGFTAFEEGVRASLNAAEDKAAKVGAHMVMVGILPTLSAGHMSPDSLSSNPRFQLLSDQILSARGEDIVIDITGPERLRTTSDSIVPEAACTSTQLHIQVSPDDFPAYWNASQAIAGVQLALGANSPFLLGRELWRETRIALFEQATDTRSEELKAQGVRPRVWFGERWITSIFDLFEENVRYFPALLPIIEDEDPLETLESGETPRLAELRLHNGTIYRWNRPVYDVVGGVPHLRVENRVLPAGPTVVDTMANAAFYFGLVRTLAQHERPLWSQMSFSAAEENFHLAARQGIEAQLYWPGVGQVPATELAVRRLLPMARAGLDSWGVLPEESDRLLGVIEQRCLRGQNGASWFTQRFHECSDGGDADRLDALRVTLNEYRAHMHTNEPVHTWPSGQAPAD
jgi:gamma-glutamyl:cysteine ligase YbdK (ATP-grasp superfamily)